MTSQISLTARIPPQSSGCRFDQVAAELFPDYSRSRLQQWIKDGLLTLDGKAVKPNTKVAGGETVSIEAEPLDEGEWLPEDGSLNVVYADEHIIVLDKPADLVVHPAAGNWTGTLLNRLIFHFPELRVVPRAGIVHRLDKDTTGLMIVARTIVAQARLVEQMQARQIKREYHALVLGDLADSGVIETQMGRHPTQRTKMAVLKHGGKEAITRYSPLARFGDLTLMKLQLETGRTHQIRVHMAHLGHPLVGDPVYGRSLNKRQALRPVLAAVQDFSRQALHACRLGVVHPHSGAVRSWKSEYPADFVALLDRVYDAAAVS